MMTMKWMTDLLGSGQKLLSRFLVLAVLLTFCQPSFSQTGYASEDELIKAAANFVKESDYKSALPLYSQLVSLYPKNTVYNMNYGLCLLHADPDKVKCLKYLKYAAGNADADPVAEFHYATGLHRNYEFSKAIKHYKRFKEKGNSKEVAKLQTDRQIEMCQNGKKLITNIFDMNVVEKKEISQKEFFRIYDLGEIGGKIIVKPDEFKSKLDLKSNDVSLIHLPSDARVIYYSGYGSDKTRGKDIFKVRKTPEGNWGEPQNLGSPVNTEYDEDFPFMHPSGTLYFASKGHNSMGGYDLFKCEYNESTDTWGQPENLKFAVSSSFDDVLFISDLKGQLAYFASARNTVDGKFNVYRVQISRKPFDLAFVKGKFIAEGSDVKKAAKITIYDLEEDKKVGTYYSEEGSGDYNIPLPKSGRSYKFVVETDEDAPVHTGKVDIPEQTEVVSLNQEIRLVGSGDSEKLVIKNLFEETSTPDINEAGMLTLLRNASDLEVNSSAEEVLSQEVAVEDEKPSAEVSGDIDAQYAALISGMQNYEKDLSKDVAELNTYIAYGYKYSLEKAQSADGLYEKLEDKRDAMAAEANAGKKKSMQEEIIKDRRALEPVASDAIVSYDFTQSLDNEYNEKINDVDRIQKDLAIINASGTKGPEEKQMMVEEYQPKLDDLKSMKSTFEISPQRYADLLASVSQKLEKEEKYFNGLKSDIDNLKRDISNLENEINNSKSKKAKTQMTEEKDAKQIDLDDLQYEYSQVQQKYAKLKVEKRNLQDDSEHLNTFIANLKSNKTPVAQMSDEDKAELKKLIDHLKEQRLLEDVIGEEVEDFIAGKEERKEDLSTAQKYSAVDNSGKKTDYDQLYTVNLAAIELTPQSPEKDEEISKLYANWSETVAEDKKIEQNDLQYTKGKADKEIIEQRIEILEQKENEYKQKSQEYKDAAASVIAATPGETGSETATQSETSEKPDEIAEKDNTNTSSEKTNQTSSSTSAAGSEIPELSNYSVMLSALAITASSDNASKEEIDQSYEEKIEAVNQQVGEEKDLAIAATELNWAKSLNDQKEAKEAQLAQATSDEERQQLETEIAELDKEINAHLAKASTEFSAFEMEMFLGEVVIRPELDDELSIGFDPNFRPLDQYEKSYEEELKKTKADVSLGEQEKNSRIAAIHNNWAKTIQDEILFLNKTMKRQIAPDTLRKLRNTIETLEDRKEVHIKESNDYYNKVRLAEGLAAVDYKSPATSTSAETGAASSGTSTYASLSNDYQSEVTSTESEIVELNQKLESPDSKFEKQQVELALLVKNRELADQQKAAQDLSAKGGEALTDKEVDEIMTANAGNWSEQSKDYVFEKKNFSENAPDGGEALKAHTNAQQMYEEVQSLEKQKSAYLESEIVNAEAAAELERIEEEIVQKKIEAYESLARANNLQYNENRRKIDAYLEANPNLKTENPKLYRQIMSASVIYEEVEKYQEDAKNYTSNDLKYRTYDVAQFMSEYVLAEQDKILGQIGAETYTGELAFLSGDEKASQSSVSVQADRFKISESEHKEMIEMQAFVEYEKDLKALEEIDAEQKEISAQIESKDQEIADLVKQSDEFKTMAINVKKGKRKKLLKEAAVIDQEIEVKRKERDSLALASVQLSERERVIKQNSQRLLSSVSPEQRYKMLMLAEVRYQQKDEAQYITTSDVPAADETTGDETSTDEAGTPVVVAEGFKTVDDNEFVSTAAAIPTELETDLFIQSATGTATPYSESKPIPVDQQRPSGLIFQVQIGAFRNPIPQDLFKGFAPLMGEKRGDGITRYTAGLFRDFANANNAKNEIRKLGYYDAFVVAYMDGQRISFQELRGLGDIDLTTKPSGKPVLPGEEVPIEVLTTPTKIVDQGQVSNAIAEQTVNTYSVQGIFFTVQVGVYTNTLLPDRLKPVQELNSELLENGNIRYSAGQFISIDDARQRQALIRQQGISDAFVTAYNNGQRISVQEALRLSGE